MAACSEPRLKPGHSGGLPLYRQTLYHLALVPWCPAAGPGASVRCAGGAAGGQPRQRGQVPGEALGGAAAEGCLLVLVLQHQLLGDLVSACARSLPCGFPRLDAQLLCEPQADVEREFAAEKFGLKTFPTIVLLPKGSKGGELRRPAAPADACLTPRQCRLS